MMLRSDCAVIRKLCLEPFLPDWLLRRQAITKCVSYLPLTFSHRLVLVLNLHQELKLHHGALARGCLPILDFRSPEPRPFIRYPFSSGRWVSEKRLIQRNNLPTYVFCLLFFCFLIKRNTENI